MTDGPKQLSDIPGVNVPAMRAIQADWPDTCEWLANHIWSLEMRLEASRAELAAAKAEVERSSRFKIAYAHALNCVDRVFQKCSENPHPILPDFCRPGADKFEAVILLAQEFVKVRDENERLLAYREIMESTHGKRLYAISHLLEHFDADGNLKGNGKWRITEIYKCCKSIDEASTEAARRFDNLDASRKQ